jgi:1-deoxy-D-xylulose-5-phosphate reductoisomerase
MRVVALAAGQTSSVWLIRLQCTCLKLCQSTRKLLHTICARCCSRADVDLPRIVVGEAGLVEVATHPQADCVISATSEPLVLFRHSKRSKQGKRVALANKETLVMAGELMTRPRSKSGAELLPVDSEHNALHQCLRGERHEEVRRIILTASGGPFRTKNKAEMKLATVAEAMQHPTWNMGAKITIDSATLMNKGLEVIEAHWLFGFGPDRSTSSFIPNRWCIR